MVKSPAVEVLSPPKANAQTAGSPDAESLNINAPLAVTVALENVRLAKSPRAVVLLATGVTLVKAAPFAV